MKVKNQEESAEFLAKAAAEEFNETRFKAIPPTKPMDSMKKFPSSSPERASASASSPV